ncbi:hypothetical protein L218DRAFT_860713 [Marasmius fiardii PR-910]|nr:hypothetical protein L218DRAFT_860713 [Marasmius fiardii PR-910]
MVDSTYAGSVTESSTSCGSGCPEGLLIDFEEPVQEHDSPVDLTSAPSSAPRIGENNGGTSVSRTQVPSSRPFNPLDARYRIGGIDEYANRNRTESSARAASVTEPSPTREYSHFTDLDLLVSRLDETELRNGSSYDTLLMLSEFVGSASPPSHTSTRNVNHQRAVTSLPPSESKPFLPAPLLGQVSLDRRRVTKDGRVRVKLVLLECGVDKCGICLTQFKEGDCAVMSSIACHHAFHETCLRRWLSGNSKTCPNCRIQIGDIQSC